MSDDRPQYGEYSTPEEQRRLAGLPPLDPATADLPPAGYGAASASAPAASVTAPTASTPPRRVDRIVTIALLAYGLVNVVVTAISYLDLPTVMNQYMQILGIAGEFTNLDDALLWGGIAAAALTGGYALTLWGSWRRMRSGKLAWWLPIVGAIAASFVVSLCLVAPMIGDPAFSEFLQTGGI